MDLKLVSKETLNAIVAAQKRRVWMDRRAVAAHDLINHAFDFYSLDHTCIGI